MSDQPETPDSHVPSRAYINVAWTTKRDSPEYGAVSLIHNGGGNMQTRLALSRELAERLRDQLTALLKEPTP